MPGRQAQRGARGWSASAARRQTTRGVRSAGPRARNRSSAVPATSRRSRSEREPLARRATCRAARGPARCPDRPLGKGDQDSQRSVERLLDDPRHFGLVGHLEARIQIRFERELVQQRQAERVDGADRDRPPADRAGRSSAPGRSPTVCRGVSQLRDDALAHLGGSFSRERDRQDVGRIDARLHEVYVPRHQYRRLAGAGRGLEHDVVARIDGERASFSVRSVRSRSPDSPIGEAASIEQHDRGPNERQLGAVSHHRRNPCGRPSNSHIASTATGSSGRGGKLPDSMAVTARAAVARLRPAPSPGWFRATRTRSSLGTPRSRLARPTILVRAGHRAADWRTQL